MLPRQPAAAHAVTAPPAALRPREERPPTGP
jgi:hypothetical protein